MIPFPFEAFQQTYHGAFPDIVISFLGQPLRKSVWKDIAALVSIRSSPSDDPFREDADKGCHRTLLRIAKDACTLMAAHGLLAAFVLGIFGDAARIIRYDHSGIVASPAFSLRLQPETLRQFFWRFVHPPVGGTIVGCDPTSRCLTGEELAWVQECLRRAGERPLQAPDVCRRVEVYTTGSEAIGNSVGSSQAFFLLRLIDIKGHLFSRFTTVWLAIPDPGGLPTFTHANGPEKLRKVIVKDAWRHLDDRSEKSIYDRLASTIPADQYDGLPRLLCGGDLSEMEVAQKVAIADGTAYEGLTSYPSQQTFTWRLLEGDLRRHHDRTHTRIVVDVVGRPLTRFRSTREMVLAMRDAVKGASIFIRVVQALVIGWSRTQASMGTRQSVTSRCERQQYPHCRRARRRRVPWVPA